MSAASAYAVMLDGDVMVSDVEEDIEHEFEHDTDLITREQMLKKLQEDGYKVTEWQLRSWATYGLIPHPIRRVPPGATDGKARALYPVWMTSVITSMLHEKAKGLSRDELREIVWLLIDIHRMSHSVDKELATEEERKPPPPRIPRALQRTVWDYADRVAAQGNSPAHQVTVWITTEEGGVIDVNIDRPRSSRGEDSD